MRQLFTWTLKRIYVKYHQTNKFIRVLAIYKYKLNFYTPLGNTWSQLAKRKTPFIKQSKSKGIQKLIQLEMGKIGVL